MDYKLDRPYLKRLDQAIKDSLKLLPFLSPTNTIFVASNDSKINHVIKAYNRERVLVEEGRDIPHEDDFCKLVIQQGRGPLVISDISKHPLTENHPLTHQLGSGRFIGVPIRINEDQVFGTLCALDQVPGDFLEAEIQAIQTMGDLLSQVVTLEEWTICDPLSGLYNREYIQDYFLKAVEKPVKIGLLFIELDRFKRVNDVFGYSVGDEVIRTMSQRLKEAVDRKHVLSRFNGDKFIVLMQIETTENIIKLTSDYADMLLNQLSKPILLDEQEFQITANIGITHYPKDGETLDELIKNAESGLASVRETGGNAYSFYRPNLTQNLHSELEIENEIRQGLAHDEFKLFFQPQVNLLTGKLEGFETLVRWQHPQKGLLSPDHFISVAENSGWIMALGEWVLEKVCEVSRRWKDLDYHPAVELSFNLSPRQFQDPNLFAVFKRVMDRYGVDHSLLKLEITESLMIKDMDLTKYHLERFKELGVKIAIDDFGKGYSSLTYIKGLPIDTLKIDRAFVEDLEENQDSRSIIQSIMQMGTALDLYVIAEGIETRNQALLLRDYGCQHGQGYYFSEPIPEEAVLDYLQTFK